MNRPINPALFTRSAVGVQCICCGHVEAPAEDLFRCLACGGFDTRPFLAEIVEDQDDEQRPGSHPAQWALDLRLLSPGETS